LMMNAVGCYPENWTAFQRQSRAHSQTIFHPLGRSVSTMGEQAVIAHADAQTSRNPPKEHRNEHRLPGEKEQRDNCPGVKQRHESCSYPVEFVLGGGLTI